jgi:hypothetical protein
MIEPMKCKYCGAAATVEGKGWRADCGSWQFGREWHRGEGCYLRSKVAECDELRQRIDAAIIRAERAIVFGLTLEGDILCVFARDLDEVVEILRGNSPTISEGSE